MKVLSKDFFLNDTVKVAQNLIGKYLKHSLPEGEVMGRIVETEAYLSRDDPACHAFRGKTRRNEAMFGSPGTSYVYLIYGMYYCFNVVTQKEGVGEAVLIRALEPLKGIDYMRYRRGTSKQYDITNGPGKLCQAMGINKEHNGKSLNQGNLIILDSKEKPPIEKSPRIGINVAAEKLLRFYIPGNPYVSDFKKNNKITGRLP
ncbi:MAG: 3-methyladenine DNA glycosylase [Firmicutes bacterium HGW-Firmicutes-13]|nr:MAG: 3-methyladenine DNA glycosylase [Firmicutes bacterium HGW-Firmicutes-13]